MPWKGSNLTENFTADASAALGGPPWLARRRADAFARLEDLAFPSESEEVWRYSGIDEFDPGMFAPGRLLDESESAVGADLTVARTLAAALGRRSGLVVTRDGIVRGAELSPEVPEAAIELASARRESDTDVPLGLGELALPRDAFGELHEAFLRDVAVVSISPKVVIADPVVIVHLVSAQAFASDHEDGPPGLASFPRTIVRAGRSAEAGVIELVARTSGEAGPALVVPVTEIDVAEDSRLSYANLQVLDEGCTQVALQTSRIDQHGSLKSFTCSLGGRYARVRTDSDVVAQGAESSLLAAYLGTDEQVHDFRTLQDHHGPRTRSELLFKGAVADHARSVYSGLIRIARGAHGADAFQTNQNLVLSEGAHADSVPNLDIDENDVRCSHASTVGPIDEEQRYYLESRGIEPSTAERLIVLGFFSDLASRAPFGGVGRFLEDVVGRRLTGRLPADRKPGVQESHDG